MTCEREFKIWRKSKKKSREATPDHSIAHLQEELIAVRLREAEANLALKDLRHRVQDLTQLWTKHVNEQHRDKNGEAAKNEATSTPSKKLGGLLNWNSSNEAARLEEELMTTKLHETGAVAELKEARLKVMELEANVQVSTNQMKRTEEENRRLQETQDTADSTIRALTSELKEHRRKFADLESQMKEEKMLGRIRDAEKSQSLAELQQKISSLEYKNQELVTEGEVSRVGNDEDQVPRLQDKVAELKSEVARLSAINRRLSKTVSKSLSMQRLDVISGPESDDADDDDLRLRLGDGYSSTKKLSENGTDVDSNDETCERLSESEDYYYNKEPVTRKTSQTLADAFLEQLPEVKNIDAYQNGSATREERGAC